MVDWTIQETTSPPVYPVTLGEVKDHLRLTDIGGPHEHNSMLADLVIAATEEVEAHTGRALVQRSFVYRQNGFSAIELPRNPVQSITSITYLDLDGAEQTLATSVYDVDTNHEPGLITLAYEQNWPSVRSTRGSVRVTFVAGYALSGSDYRVNIPRSIKQAILMLVEDMYEFSGAKIAGAGNTVTENKTVRSLLFKHRVWY